MSRTNRQRDLIFWSLACSALLAFGYAKAQGRGPPAKPQTGPETDSAPSIAKLDEIDAWLRRLEGHYAVTHRSSRGTGTCSTFASGPGIRCIIDLPADEGETIEGPTVILYGIDPHVGGVSYLRVSPRSIAEWGVGELTGDTIRFRKVSCPTSVNQWPWLASSNARIRASGSMSILSCNRSMRIDAPRGDSSIWIRYSTELRVVLQTPSASGSSIDNRGLRPIEVNPKGSREIPFTETIQLQRLKGEENTGDTKQ